MNNKIKKNKVITVGDDGNKERIDAYLAKIYPEESRNYIQKLINDKKVLVDGSTVQKNYRIKTGQAIRIIKLNKLKEPAEIKPEAIKFDIIFEDDYLLIISKPPGISVHPSPGHYNNTLVNALLFHYKKYMNNFPERLRPGIVHRLDKDTSGILIIAKSYDIQQKLSDMFKKRKVKKGYIALVLGRFIEKTLEIRLPIARSGTNRKKMAVSINGEKEAITRLVVKKTFKNNCSLLYVYPETGRTHQIRVHLSYIEHPLIGDKKYGNKQSMMIGRNIGINRHFLHAFKISFLHPITNKLIEVEDKISKDLLKGLELLEGFKI